MDFVQRSMAYAAEMAKDANYIGGGRWPFGDRYWNIDVAKSQGVKLKRSQRRYMVRDNEIIWFDSPKNIEKERDALGNF